MGELERKGCVRIGAMRELLSEWRLSRRDTGMTATMRPHRQLTAVLSLCVCWALRTPALALDKSTTAPYHTPPTVVEACADLTLTSNGVSLDLEVRGLATRQTRPIVQKCTINNVVNIPTNLFVYTTEDYPRLRLSHLEFPTNRSLIHSGGNVFFVKLTVADHAGDSPRDVFLAPTCHCYQVPGEKPDWPAFLSLSPEAPGLLYSDSDVCSFSGTNRLTFKYFSSYVSKGGVGPIPIQGGQPFGGVDTERLRILVRDAQNSWVDVTHHFEVTPSSAVMKDHRQLQIPVDDPQVRLVLPDVFSRDSTNNVFTWRYNVVRSKEPCIVAIEPPIVGRGVAATVTIKGHNFDALETVNYQQRYDGSSCNFTLECTSRNLLKKMQRRHRNLIYDVITVRLAAPSVGLGYFALNQVSQTNVPLIVIDADSNGDIERLLSGFRDSDDDGCITFSDLPKNPAGGPDLKILVIPEDYMDPLTGRRESGFSPARNVTAGLDVITNDQEVIRAMYNLGYSKGNVGSCEAGPIVILEPVLNGRPLDIGSRLGVMGLAPMDSSRVTVGLDGTRPMVASLTPSGLFPRSGMDPLRFSVQGLALTNGLNTVTVTAERVDRKPAILSFRISFGSPARQ